MDTGRELGRWSAWISCGVILALLLLGVARALPDWADGDSPSDEAISLIGGLEALEPSHVLSEPRRLAGAGLLLPQPEAASSPGRRVVTEIFRPPIP